MSLRRRPMPFRVHPVTAAAALFGLAPCTVILAQAPAVPAAVEASDAIAEILVTATRRDEGVQDIPLNLTAVTGGAISEQKLENLADLVRLVPGLFLVDQGGRDANLLTVRGLNTSSVDAGDLVGTDGGGVVAQYIGDIPLYIDLRLKDLERVEALLGPQGTLYGAGTLGGAIRYLPKRPQFGEKSLEVETGTFAVSHSDDFGFEGQAIGNLPLGERLAVRGLFGVTNEPGFIDYGFLVREPGVSDPEPDRADAAAVNANLRRKADVNDLRTTFGRLALRYGLTEKIEGTLGYHYQKQESGGRSVNNTDSFDTGRYESAYRFVEPNDRRYQLGSLELKADFGFATLSSATGYSDYDDKGQRDQTDLLLNFEYGYEDFPSFAAYTRDIAEEKRLSQELRLVSSDTGPLSWIVGAYYGKFEQDAVSSEFAPGYPDFIGVDRPDNLEFFQLTEQESTEKAVFGEIGYEFFERLTVTVGGRHFKFRDDSRVGVAVPLVDGSGPDEILPTFDEAAVSDDDSIYKLNLAYVLTRDVLGYATLSEGYRTGGSNLLAACQDPLPPGQNVCALPNEQLIKPDKTLNHELGLRSRWLGGRLVVNTALYFIDWTDIQVAGSTVNGAIPITVNGGKAESRGVELSAQSLMGERWTLDGNYSYTRAELTRIAPGIVAGEDAFDGDRLPGSPEHQFHAALGYAQPLDNGWKLRTHYGLAAQSDVYTRAGLRNFGEVLGGYATHDASVGLDAGVWMLKLYARNLFDKFAETGVRDSRDPALRRDVEGDADGDGVTDHTFRLRRYYHSVLDPMRVGLTFTYRFES